MSRQERLVIEVTVSEELLRTDPSAAKKLMAESCEYQVNRLVDVWCRGYRAATS